MESHLRLATAETDDFGFELDLRHEERLHAAEVAERDVEGIRLLLAAVNLQPSSPPIVDDRPAAEVMDLAVFGATGSLELARVFGARR